MAVRAIEVLAVFFLSMNLFSGMLITSGAAADIGLGQQVEVGGDDAREETEGIVESIVTGAPGGETLFGMYNVLAGTLADLRVMVFGGTTMLNNAGVPGYITTPIDVVFGLVYAVATIRFLRGIA